MVIHISADNCISKRNLTTTLPQIMSRHAIELMRAYTPIDTGALVNSAQAFNGQIVQSAKYARIQYYHYGNYWFAKMKANHAGEILNILKKST